MANKQSRLLFVLHASLAAFGTYFCMYAFRKPFSVASFEGLTYFGINYKILLVIAQVVGYALSKFVGIKVISELRPNRRLHYLIALIALAEISLLLFALVPAPYNIAFMFLNGLPLGMIWGIVFPMWREERSPIFWAWCFLQVLLCPVGWLNRSGFM